MRDSIACLLLPPEIRQMDDRPDWVANTGSAGIERMWERLVEAFEFDVKRINEMYPDPASGGAVTAQMARRPPTSFNISCWRLERFPVVSALIEDQRIRIARPRSNEDILEIQIEVAMNRETGELEFILDDEPLKAWQVSMLTLVPIIEAIENHFSRRPFFG